MSAYRDPRADSLEYLEQHNIFRLFDILGSKLAYLKPEDPNEFLVAELIKISSLKQSGQPVTLFNENDLAAMFSVFDLTHRGYLTHAQYLKALNAVGVKSPMLNLPAGETIDKKTFISYMHAEILQNSFK